MKASRCEAESVCSFHNKGRKGKANQGSEKLSEGVYKRRKLCYSVKETQGRFDCEITCIVAIGADRNNVFRNQSFQRRRRDIGTEELSANVRGLREIDLVKILFLSLTNDHRSGDRFGKVVHSKSSKDFLEDKLRLFAVKTQKSDGVL